MSNKFCGLRYYQYLCIVGNRIEDYGRGIHDLKESEVARPHHSKGYYNFPYILYKQVPLERSMSCSPTPVVLYAITYTTKIVIIFHINKSPSPTVKKSY